MFRNTRDRDKILEFTKEKRKVTGKGLEIRKASDFLKTLKTRRE